MLDGELSPMDGDQPRMLQWIIRDSVATFASGRADADSLSAALTHGAIYNIVDIGDYDCSFAWRFGPDRRRWQIAATSPDRLLLHVLREFCLYEQLHGRKTVILFRQESLRLPVQEDLLRFFGPAPAPGHLEYLMARQQRRVVQLLTPDAQGHRPDDHLSSPFAPADLVCHATDASAALEIVRAGAILSAVRARPLPNDTLAAEPRNAAGDPPDYFDYVMFAPAVHPGLDKLVNERLLGRSPSWEEMEQDFTPAIRFFFRRQDILEHPRFCCDGLHEKVRDAIELAPYLAAALVPEAIDGAFAVADLLRRNLPAVPLVQLRRDQDTPTRWASRIAAELLARKDSLARRR